MTDKRRRRWLAIDVFAYSSRTGEMIYNEFGATGLALWMGVLQLAKRSQSEGTITYTTDSDLLAQVGMPGANLINEAGDNWTVQQFFRRLGERRQTVSRMRGGCSETSWRHWQDWQKVRLRGPEGSDNPTSDDTITDQLEPDTATMQPDTGPDKTRHDSDKTINPKSLKRVAVDKSAPRRRMSPEETTAAANARRYELDMARQANPCEMCEGDKMLADDSGFLDVCPKCHGTGVAA